MCFYDIVDKLVEQSTCFLQTVVDGLVQRHRPAVKKESRRSRWYWWGRGYDDKSTPTDTPTDPPVISTASSAPGTSAATTMTATATTLVQDDATGDRTSHASTSTLVEETAVDGDVTTSNVAEDTAASHIGVLADTVKFLLSYSCIVS